MQTQCVPCGKVLANPSAAAKHVLKHPAPARSGKSEWGPDAYAEGERWDAYASRTVPPTHAQIRAGQGPDSPDLDADALPHGLLRWDQTECICDDHYQPEQSWQMTESGKGVGAHRHRDLDGRCITCGGEADH